MTTTFYKYKSNALDGQGPLVDRPTDLTAAAAGFLWWDTDNLSASRWDGTTWYDVSIEANIDLTNETNARIDADNLLIPLAQKGAANGVAPLDGSSMIGSQYLPSIAISDTYVVGSQAAMLALAAQRGDVAIRNDTSKAYILSTDSPTTLADWKELLTPPDLVTSVNGRQGIVSGLAEDNTVVHLTGAESITGLKTFSPVDASTVGAIVKGFSGQSVDLLRLNNSSDITLSKFDSVGKLFVSDGNTPNAALLTTDYIVISAQATAPGFSIVSSASGAGNRAVFKGVRSGGTLVSPTVPSVDDNVVSFLGAVYDGVTTQGTAVITFYIDGTVSSGVAPQRISFVTSTTSGAARTEKMSIRSDGRIQLGGYVNDVNATAALNVRSLTDITTLQLRQASGGSAHLIVGLDNSGNPRFDVEPSGRTGIGTSLNVDTLLSVGGTNAHPSSSTSLYGLAAQIAFPSTATSLASSIYAQVRTSAASFTLVDARAIWAGSPSLGANSAVTTMRGVVIDNQGATGVTNAYGLIVVGQSGASTLNIAARLDGGTQANLWLNNDTASVAGGIAFGTARDVTLYRSSAQQLKTDGGMNANNVSIGGSGSFPSGVITVSNSGSATTGSSSAATTSIKIVTGTTNFITTAQTGDVSVVNVEQRTLTSTPASSVIPDLASLRVKGAIVGTNTTFTRNQAVLIETGADTAVGLAVRANSSSQSADLLSLQSSSASSVLRVDLAGRFTLIGSTPNTSSIIELSADHPGTAPDGGGISFDLRVPTTMTNSATMFTSRFRTAVASFTIGTVTGFKASSPTLGAGSAITNVLGVQILNQGASGITNAYGLDINAQSGAATLNTAARLSGGTTANLWLNSDTASIAGGIAFGTSRDTELWRQGSGHLRSPGTFSSGLGAFGTTSVDVNNLLNVGSSAVNHSSTGINITGVMANFVIPTTATSSTNYLRSVPVTAANASAGTVTGFRADTPSLGASSSIANANGINILNQGATGITNAYGIDVAAQSGASGSNVAARFSGGTQANLWLNSDTASVAGGIAFGTAKDVVLYRLNSTTLQTTSNLIVARIGVNSQIAGGAYISILGAASYGGGSTGTTHGFQMLTGTTNFITTAQTGDVSSSKIDQQTYTSTPASSVIPDLSTLRIKGSIVGTNTTFTRNQAVLIETGSDTAVGLVVRANSSTQSAHVQQWQDSAGNASVAIGLGGRMALITPTISDDRIISLGGGANHPSTASSVNGLISNFLAPSTATVTCSWLQSAVRTVAASFTLTAGIAQYIQVPTVGAGSAITTIMGIRAENQGATGIANAYGILVSAQSGASASNTAVRLDGGTTANLWLNSDTGSVAGGIAFGTARDVGIFRNSSTALGTLGGLVVNDGDLGVVQSAATSIISLSSSAGQVRDLSFRTAGLARWILRTEGTAEGGSDSGSNFQIVSRDDAGAFKATILSITRSSGLVTWADGTNFAFNATTGTQIATSTSQKFAFHGSTAVIQRASAAQAAVVTTAATNIAPYGFTQAQADSIVTLVNELRAAMVEKGLIKGAA